MNVPRTCRPWHRKTKTIRGRKLTATEKQQQTEYADYDGAEKPETRAQCENNGIRPCPYVSCIHNLFLDVMDNDLTSSIRLNFPEIDPTEMKYSCALDEANRAGLTLPETAERLNITRERVRQIEQQAFLKLRIKAPWLAPIFEALLEIKVPDQDFSLPTSKKQFRSF